MSLEVRWGSVEGASMRVALFDGPACESTGARQAEGRIVRKPYIGADGLRMTLVRDDYWRRLAVITSGKVDEGKTQRYFELEPAEEEHELSWRGFYVRGNFRVTRRENNSRKAREAWKAACGELRGGSDV